jgi:hypothetical protein
MKSNQLTEFIDRILRSLKSVWDIYGLLLALGTSAISQWQQHPDLCIWLIALSPLLFLPRLFHIYLKKTTIRQAIITRPTSEANKLEHYLFSPTKRCLALAGIVVILVAPTSVILGWKLYSKLDNKLITIMVANFDGPDREQYRVTDIIIERLRELTTDCPEIKIKTVGKSITAIGGSDEAKKEGNGKCQFLIWGWYGKTGNNVEIVAHLESIQRATIYPKGFNVEKTILTVPISEFESFKVQKAFSNGLAYLMLFTAGLASYEAGDKTNAVRFFSTAIAKGAPETENEALHGILLFSRACGYMEMRNWPSALADLKQSSKINPYDSWPHSCIATSHLINTSRV